MVTTALDTGELLIERGAGSVNDRTPYVWDDGMDEVTAFLAGFGL